MQAQRCVEVLPQLSRHGTDVGLKRRTVVDRTCARGADREN